MIYVVTTGSYSDYGFVAVCEGPDDLDIDAISKEFADKYGARTIRDAAIIAQLKSDGFTAINCNTYNGMESASLTDVFSWWAERNYGFKTLAHKEIWIGDL